MDGIHGFPAAIADHAGVHLMPQGNAGSGPPIASPASRRSATERYKGTASFSGWASGAQRGERAGRPLFNSVADQLLVIRLATKAMSGSGSMALAVAIIRLRFV